MTTPVATALQWLAMSPAPLAALHPDGVIAGATPAFLAAVGAAPAATLEGIDLMAMLAPDHRAIVRELVAAVAERDEAAPHDPLVVGGRTAPLGPPFLLHLSLLPVPGHGAVLAHAERANPPVVPAGTSIDPPDTFGNQLSAALSHDIRASLRSVNGFLGLVERALAGPHDEQALKHLHTAREAGVTADRGVEALVRLMRVRERALAVRTTSLRAVLDKAVQHSTEVLPGPMPPLQLPAEAHTVLGDPVLCGELLAELFTNSRKFGGPDVRLSVACTEQDGWLYLSVTDDGPGIAADLIDDAFRLFRLLQPKGRFPGIGMGLPFARAIAEAHGGWLRLESGGDGGVTARLRLPAGEHDG